MLVGIAKLASEGSVLAEKRRVQYRSLPTRRWLNRCHSRRVPFDWTINPYRGCEFGCKYCYARFTHDFLERGGCDAFETEIYAKQFDRQEFVSQLRSLKPGQVVGLGTATDPYQPAERRFGLTARVLEALQLVSGISLFITTKSDFVSRDAALLAEISRRNNVRVTMSVVSLDAQLTRLVEPFAPRPDLRLEALRRLAESHVSVGVIASPVLPLLTDGEDNLLAVASAAREAGASCFGANVLFLKPEAQRSFFPFLQANFPQHLARYRQNYARGAYLKGAYPEFVRQRVDRVRSTAGIPGFDFVPPRPEEPRGQQSLF